MEKVNTSVLPLGFPERLSGPLAWSGKDFQTSSEEYVKHLSENDITHIEAATEHFQGLGVARGLASPLTFPLPPALAERLRTITDTVYNGRGFHVLRGIQPSRYTEEQRVIIYAGLTSYVANRRARNIDHIRDRTHVNPMRDKLKPLEQSVSMGFHTDIDVGDILTMFTQSVPQEGGDQYLASIVSIYNTLAESDPKVLETLSENWYWERIFRPAVDEEKLMVLNRPLIAYENGQLQVNCAATFVGGNPDYPLSSSAPPLSMRQSHALNALQDAARQKCVRIVPHPGDMLFVNNYAIMHARDSWVDSTNDEQRRRYIMRLWLHDDKKGWKSATALERILDDNFDLPAEKQGLMTGEEWQALPRGWRVKEMGVSATYCHD